MSLFDSLSLGSHGERDGKAAYTGAGRKQSSAVTGRSMGRCSLQECYSGFLQRGSIFHGITSSQFLFKTVIHQWIEY